MNVKQLLVLTIAAAALTAQAEETAADKAEPASATAEQR